MTPADGAARCEIVVVENASTDATAEIAAAYAERGPVPVTLLRQDEASMVTSRARGFTYLLARQDPPAFLISADADTLFPPSWLGAVLAPLRRGEADVVSSAGYMNPELWSRCPGLTRRYVQGIGTIFFDPTTVARLGLTTRPFLFTEQVFRDFGRPVSDAGFAMTSECYRSLGGFRKLRYDDGNDIAAAGWPFMFRADLARRRVRYVPSPWWTTSPRRLIAEPAAVYSTSAYVGEMTSFRREDDDAYRALDELAEHIDLRPLQEYCLKYYVLQQCVTRPWKLRRNARYFGKHLDDVESLIRRWRASNRDPEAGRILSFVDELSSLFAGPLLAQLRSLELRP
jgi:glycosyltransferase involved in cell wall biosynthesis